MIHEPNALPWIKLERCQEYSDLPAATEETTPATEEEEETPSVSKVVNGESDESE